MKTCLSQDKPPTKRIVISLRRRLLGVAFALVLSVLGVKGFSLLGPYADWMQPTNGYRLSGDIGGPMALGEEYRWNVSVVTYAFDQSFLDYFGSNGVAAVEQAFQVLNDLPPASSIVLSNYPLDSKHVNYKGSALMLYDLKSTTLSLLMEQLGLGEPTRNVFDLRRWDPSFLSLTNESSWSGWAIPDFIIERNFDPETLAPSHYVNDTLYTGTVTSGPLPDVVESPVDPLDLTLTAVADRVLSFGKYYHLGLTRDDVGGLSYLLRTNNFNYETLLPGVHGAGTNAGSYVNRALRAGVDKVTFVRQEYDSGLGQAVPITNQFTDTYITNNTVMHQQLERVITQPDFLFYSEEISQAARVARTGTSNWCDNAAWYGGATEAGPGVIWPPVRITFHRPSYIFATSDALPGAEYLGEDIYFWGSFDYSTNDPIRYPAGPLPQCSNQMMVQLQLRGSNIVSPGSLVWQLPVPLRDYAIIETSTNLRDWEFFTIVHNNGAPVKWEHWCSLRQRFFHCVPHE